jgi:ADP-heptose:LPS heptosyltransferase
MHVVAFRQDNNGDVLLAGPALRALAASASRVTLVCGPSGAAAAHTLPGIDEVIVAEAGWIEAQPHAVTRADVDALVDRLAALAADLALIFTSFHQSPLPAALLARMAGIARVGAISVAYGGSLLDLRHHVDDDVHEVERALSLAAAAGFRLPPGDDARVSMRIADDNPLAALRPYTIVHPGATVAARAWDPERNRALVRALARRGERVIVTGSASEAALCAHVAGDAAIDACGIGDFATFGRIVADADAIVCGNTGATHVAAAVGTPVVELFAPTIPLVRFRPWMVEHAVLGDQEIACRGCRARTCPLPDQPCLGGVSVTDVLAAHARVRRRSTASMEMVS